MKKEIMALISTVILISCASDPTSVHETRWSADKRDSVVYVRYVDNAGQTQDFYMNYLLFSMLYRNGGYANCYNYHTSHRSEYNTVRYTSYSGYTAPPAMRTTQRTTSDSRSAGSFIKSSPSRTYSPPSRSYSSPSRSFSSPSRSFSSPSRSFSSPSRSFSSPSRH